MTKKKIASTASKDSLSAHADRAALKSVSALSERDLLEHLRSQGITNLDELVRAAVGSIKEAAGHSGGNVARDTFIYTQAVYKTAMPAPVDFDNSIMR